MTKKIAIPTVGNSVNAHFGRSQEFTIFETEGNKVLRQESIDTSTLQHQHA
ncbi:MAG: diguanylate cyclase, partial [Desulfitobacterium hafniense]|nr:diguanylate cyclase [Desulfitobacterium hafniense]